MYPISEHIRCYKLVLQTINEIFRDFTKKFIQEPVKFAAVTVKAIFARDLKYESTWIEVSRQVSDYIAHTMDIIVN